MREGLLTGTFPSRREGGLFGPIFSRPVNRPSANDNKVEWYVIDPGQPQQDGYPASHNSSLRDECSNEEILDSPADDRRELALHG